MVGVAGEVGLKRSCRLLVVLLACGGGLLYDAVGAQAAETRKPATHTIVIEGLKYVPETLTVKRGDTVVWVNKDPFPHTATAKGGFDSHEIAAGKSWKLTPSKAGDYAYICTLHPNMAASLKVE